ncbi:hypothetical protein C8A05DRAFT_39615 [Staphylotrichum tortipilum]|uniref:Uncharacterized protein n=1 Tax=Staphylotrichum tortipilum TaxID=2831512 RepID=A0AAN6RNR4_9PEZI|nr:hypothetical protein C8A05DRAFT_39615 [Staphylotrichum longicolle]
MKNVAYNTKKKWNGSLEAVIVGRALLGSGRTWINDADGILCAWRDVVYSDTEDDFEKRWSTLENEFEQQPAIVDYLRDTYFPMRHEFAQFHTKKHRNFGVRVTSRTESAHGVLKRFLKNRNNDLLTLVNAIEEALARLQENFAARLQEQTSKKIVRYNSYIFKQLWYHVGFAAFGLIAAQVKIAEEAIAKNKTLPCYPTRAPVPPAPHWRAQDMRPTINNLHLRGAQGTTWNINSFNSLGGQGGQDMGPTINNLDFSGAQGTTWNINSFNLPGGHGLQGTPPSGQGGQGR